MSLVALPLLAGACAVFALVGLACVLAGTLATHGFVRRSAAPPGARQPISILKPLCGGEPLLDDALASFCRLDYPEFQLILGVRDEQDPALAAVARVRARWPDVDITVVVDPALHGHNRKVSNLMNMMHAARHDLLVFSDSDLHVPADYLQSLADTLAQPGVGLVTTLTVGRPARRTLFAALGCLQISHCFMPSVLISRRLGRQDCLGTTMALHRRTLGLAGGLQGLLSHLADDHVLGRRVQGLGLSVALAPVIPATTVDETGLASLWQHELRWARTMGALEPLLFRGSVLQYPLFWAALAMITSGGRLEFALLFVTAWALRAAGMLGVARALHPIADGCAGSAWLLPLRDVLSAAVLVASFCGNQVIWRGHAMHADDGLPLRRVMSAAEAAMLGLTEEGRP